MSLLADVETLKKSPLPEVRETIAKKVSEYFNANIFENEEESISCDIMRLLAKDVEVRVRYALSEALKHNVNVPHDIILRLAVDEEQVAVPILEFSKVLTEGDIIEIIQSTENVAKLIAITKREEVNEPVSSALIHKRNADVTVNLFKNKKALISQESFNIVIEEFSKNGNVVSSLIDRGGLSVGIVEKMISLTSDHLREKIKNKYNISGLKSNELAIAIREEATLGLMNDEDRAIENEINIEALSQEKISLKAEQIAKHLYNEKRLTSSLILRSICEGNFAFFESSLSLMSGVPLINVRALVRSGDKKALESLLKRAKFPISVAGAISIIIEFVINEKKDFQKFSNYEKQKLIEYISENDYEKTIPLMQYIITLIGSKIQLSNITNQ